MWLNHVLDCILPKRILIDDTSLDSRKHGGHALDLKFLGNKLRDGDPSYCVFWGFITSKTESFYLHSQKKVLCHSFKCGISCIPCVTFDLCLPGLTILFSVRICHHQGTKGGGAREKRVSRFKTPSKLTGSLHLHWIALDGESI